MKNSEWDLDRFTIEEETETESRGEVWRRWIGQVLLGLCLLGPYAALVAAGVSLWNTRVELALARARVQRQEWMLRALRDGVGLHVERIPDGHEMCLFEYWLRVKGKFRGEEFEATCQMRDGEVTQILDTRRTAVRHGWAFFVINQGGLRIEGQTPDPELEQFVLAYLLATGRGNGR